MSTAGDHYPDASGSPRISPRAPLSCTKRADAWMVEPPRTGRRRNRRVGQLQTRLRRKQELVPIRARQVEARISPRLRAKPGRRSSLTPRSSLSPKPGSSLSLRSQAQHGLPRRRSSPSGFTHSMRSQGARTCEAWRTGIWPRSMPGKPRPIPNQNLQPKPQPRPSRKRGSDDGAKREPTERFERWSTGSGGPGASQRCADP
jgi:hypothetical protein